MDNNIKESVESMAKEIRSQAQTMKVDTFLAYLYTADIIDKYLHCVMGDQKVSRAGFNILHNLILNDGTMLPSKLSRKTLRSKYAVTRAIDTLEKQCLVKRVRTGQDHRTRRINITRKGLDVVKNATIDSREHISQAIFRTLEKKQTEELNTTLKTLRRHVLTLIDEIESKK